MSLKESNSTGAMVIPRKIAMYLAKQMTDAFRPWDSTSKSGLTRWQLCSEDRHREPPTYKARFQVFE
jgi:hypothetical protein